MSVIAPTDTTYTRFAEDQAYVQANNAFVERLPLAPVTRILDLACGTGAVGQLLMARAPKASLHGIDLDPVQIGLAAENYARLGYTVRVGDEALATPPAGAQRTVSLVVGSAEVLPFPQATFDCVTIANAIHLIADKDGLAGSIARVLQPGGIFAFSSGFYAGCWPPVTQQVYYEWLKEATAWIARFSAERVAAGEPPIRRVRGKSYLSPVAYQNRWLTPAEWRELLNAKGFEVLDLNERAVMFDHHSLASVGAYSGLAEAQLAGYPVELASQALANTAALALESANVTSVQHNWLEICAVRRAS
ncbi:class I SAM-dependent methyltransferase [Ideonella sp. BN130291]|uniref:class I SAM-dependent methyltransferase n=1 Tax=Ideonella sp. BN130291 TaxID=3112940 RepID=UPI002E2670C6|nr:methyltransferase domain-containing protein [Ideonella sp. BN130291]